jgi:hypothetical protein
MFSGSAAHHGLWPPRSRGFLITHNDAPKSVGLLWTSDQLVAETSTWQHKHTQRTNIYAPGGIRTHDRSRRAAVDTRLRPRGHWDRRLLTNVIKLHELIKVLNLIRSIKFSLWPTATSGPRPPVCRGFMITLRHTTLGKTSLDDWSARCRNIYLTTYNTHKRQTSMPPARFEPKIPASEGPQNHC